MNDASVAAAAPYRPWERVALGLRRKVCGKNKNIIFLNLKVNGLVVNDSTGTSIVSAAKQFRDERLAALRKQPVNSSKADRTKFTLGDCLATWEHRTDASNYSAKTKNQLGDRLKGLLNSWAAVQDFKRTGQIDFKTLRPKDVDYDTLLAWKKHFLAPAEYDGEACECDEDNCEHRKKFRPGLGLSSDYYNRLRKILIEVFAIAIEFRQRVDNPAERLPWATVEKDEVKIPAPAELEKALSVNFLESHTRDYLWFLAYFGLRKGEINALRREDIHLQAGKIWVRPFKGRKGSKKGRSVPIFSEARDVVERVLSRHKNGQALFPIRSARKQFQRACEAVGLEHKFNHHSLRHFFASVALQHLKNVRVVAELLGHKDNGKTVLSTYAHLIDNDVSALRNKVRFGISSEPKRLRRRDGQR